MDSITGSFHQHIGEYWDGGLLLHHTLREVQLPHQIGLAYRKLHRFPRSAFRFSGRRHWLLLSSLEIDTILSRCSRPCRNVDFSLNYTKSRAFALLEVVDSG